VEYNLNKDRSKEIGIPKTFMTTRRVGKAEMRNQKAERENRRRQGKMRKRVTES